MQISGFDHIVLCTKDVAATRSFYESCLGMRPVEERSGKWSLHFGPHKISLQDVKAGPPNARNTTPGSGNFCLLTATPMNAVVEHLETHGVKIIEGPGERIGATGTLLSVYFRDPDDNLVEVSTLL